MFPFLSCALNITPITAQDYDALIENATLVVADAAGEKVLTTKTGDMLKVFRRKRLFSSAFFAPYAVRFVNNAIQLTDIGIHTIQPLTIQHCAQRQLHVVRYAPIAGRLLRAALQDDTSGDLLVRTARYIASLHGKGVYFRSLHFENVIIDNTRFGLIDIADMKIYPQALNKNLRERNFQHFLRYPPDAEIIAAYGLDRFRQAYEDAGIAGENQI